MFEKLLLIKTDIGECVERWSLLSVHYYN